VIVGSFTDSYNSVVRSVKNYKAQVYNGELGGGGKLGVQGQGVPAPAAAPASEQPASAVKSKVKKKK